MDYVVSIVLIVLTFFGYTPTPESIVEVPEVRATIQAVHEGVILPVSTGTTSTETPVGSKSVEEPPPGVLIIPIITYTPMPEEPIAPAFEVEVPATAAPEPEKIFIASELVVEQVGQQGVGRPILPLYSGCVQNPTASFFVHVKDQDGNDMEGVGVSYVGTAPNNPGGMFTSLKGGGNFHYTIKDVEEGPISLTFYVKPTESTELVKHFDLQVLKAPTEPSERPAWCD